MAAAARGVIVKLLAFVVDLRTNFRVRANATRAGNPAHRRRFLTLCIRAARGCARRPVRSPCCCGSSTRVSSKARHRLRLAKAVRRGSPSSDLAPVQGGTTTVRWRDEWCFACWHALMFGTTVYVRRRTADFLVKLDPLFDPVRAGQGEMALRLLRIDAANQLPAVLLRQLTHSSTVVADSSVKLLFRLFRYDQRAPSGHAARHQVLMTAAGALARGPLRRPANGGRSWTRWRTFTSWSRMPAAARTTRSEPASAMYVATTVREAVRPAANVL